MIWAIPAFVGVPLRLCAVGLFTVIYRNRALRKRHGDIAARVWKLDASRWTRGPRYLGVRLARPPCCMDRRHGHIVEVDPAQASLEQQKRLHRLGDDPAITTMITDESTELSVAAAGRDGAAVLGPFLLATSDQNTLGVRERTAKETGG